MPIQMPRFQEDYPDRDLECQQALEEIFQHVLSTAARCGWSREESAAALQQLAHNYQCQTQANEETAATIQSLGKTRH